MGKELRIKHSEINDSQTITPVMEDKFKEKGMDIHRHEVTDIHDDHKKGERVLKIKNTRYFSVGDIPWHKE